MMSKTFELQFFISFVTLDNLLLDYFLMWTYVTGLMWGRIKWMRGHTVSSEVSSMNWGSLMFYFGFLPYVLGLQRDPTSPS